VVSGVLFIVIGVLFIVFDGTAGLVGADPATSAAAENGAVSLGAGVPDLVVLGAIALVTVAVVVWRVLRPDDGSREG
jgi:hypothetical protein